MLPFPNGTPQGRRLVFPLLTAMLGAVLGAVGIWSIYLVKEVRHTQSEVGRRSGWLRQLEAAKDDMGRWALSHGPVATAHLMRSLEQAQPVLDKLQELPGQTAQFAEAVTVAQSDISRLTENGEATDPAVLAPAVERAFSSLGRLDQAVRQQYLELAGTLGRTWHVMYYAGAAAILSSALSVLLLWLAWRREQNLLSVQAALEIEATHDHLTGLFNHGAILDFLQRELTRSRRDRRPLSVLVFDLDHFKRVNDRLGHLAGDTVLRNAANRLAYNLRSYDGAGRYGGEEFLLVLPDCDVTGAMRLAERLRLALAETPVPYLQKQIHLTTSVGVACTSQMEEDPCGGEALIRAGDAALYRAKQAGRNRVVLANTDEFDEISNSGRTVVFPETDTEAGTEAEAEEAV